MPPNSRNEKLAQRMYELNFCEQRESGIDRAIAAIEEMNLPAPKIRKEANYTLEPAARVREPRQSQQAARRTPAGPSWQQG